MKNDYRFLLLFSLLLTILTAGPSMAAEYEVKPVICPVSGHEFFGLNIHAINTLKHRDGDFFLRAEGGNQYATWVWTCPYCFFSARPDVFDGETAVDFDPSSIEKVELTEAARESEMVQLRIPPDVKYRNAAAYYHSLGEAPYFLGVLNLYGSWAVRVEKVSLPPGHIGTWWKSYMAVTEEGETASEEALQLAEAEDLSLKLEASGDEAERGKLRFLLATTLRQAGEHRRAKPILEAILSDPDSKDLAAPAARELELAKAESAFQTEALRYFKEALQFKETLPEDRLQSIYLVGELSRRLGDFEAAKAWFTKSEENPMPQRWARILLKRQKSRLKQDMASR